MAIFDYDVNVVDSIVENGRPTPAAVDHAAKLIHVERRLWNTPKVMLVSALPTLAPTTGLPGATVVTSIVEPKKRSHACKLPSKQSAYRRPSVSNTARLAM